MNRKKCGGIAVQGGCVARHDCTNLATRISHVYEGFSVYVCDTDHEGLDPWMEDTIKDLSDAAEARELNRAKSMA